MVIKPSLAHNNNGPIMKDGFLYVYVHVPHVCVIKINNKLCSECAPPDVHPPPPTPPHTQQENHGRPQNPQDTVFSKLQHTTLNEFQSIILSSRSNKQLEHLLEKKLHFSPTILESALRRAVASNKVDLLRHTLEVSKLFPSDCSMKIGDELLLQFIHKAINRHNQETLGCLLSYISAPDLPSTESSLQNYAILAAQIGFLDAVLLLCSKFPSCLNQTDQGYSVLLAVACSSSPETHHVVSELLRLGVYPNIQEPSGDTALHIAVQRANVEIVKLLLTCGACVNFPNVKNEKPVNLSHDREITQLLQECQSPLLSEVSLYHAAEEGDMKAVERLLAKGISVDSRWIKGRTALFTAARRGERAMVEFLLSKGASSFPAGSVWPELPVFHALEGDNPLIACRLVSCVDQEYKELTDATRKHIRKQLVYLLHYCACKGTIHVAKLILTSNYKINPNDVFQDDLAPLHRACQYGQLEMVKLLLSYGKEPSLRTQFYKNTPFHYACFYGQIKVAQYLLATFPKLVKMDCKNHAEETPLYCVLSGQLSSKEKAPVKESAVVFLISRGAKLTKPNNDKCELSKFNLNYASQHWMFVPFHTQKLIMVLRDELQPYSLANLARFTVRSALREPVSEEVIDSLNLPYRLHNYLLLKDWFPTN